MNQIKDIEKYKNYNLVISPFYTKLCDIDSFEDFFDKEKIIDLELFSNIVSYIAEHRTKGVRINLHIYGVDNEKIWQNKVYKLFNILYQYPMFDLYLHTDGTFITEYNVELCRRTASMIEYSTDNAIKIIELKDYFKELHTGLPFIKINYQVTNSNIKSLFEVFKILSKINLDQPLKLEYFFDKKFSSFAEFKRQIKDINDFLKEELSREEFNRNHKLVYENLYQMMLRIFAQYQIQEGTFNAQDICESINNLKCGYERNDSIIIDASGSIYNCFYSKPIRTIYDNKVALHSYIIRESDKYNCENCKLCNVCSGGCSFNQETLNDDVEYPSKGYCTLNRALFDSTLDFLNTIKLNNCVRNYLYSDLTTKKMKF